jgi:hypothetical protein
MSLAMKQADVFALRPARLAQLIRSQPHLYSAVCKARIFYSRYCAAAPERKLYKGKKNLFSMTAFEKEHSDNLKRNGFTVLESFFKGDLVETISTKADLLFRSLQLDFYDAYSVQTKSRVSLEGLSYAELEASEKMISMRDPLLNVSEVVDIAFHESILRIITNFLGYIPPRFKPMIVRDFPLDRPRQSSNFHRDNDESDTVQFFVYLDDIDDRRGPLVYIPRTDRYDVKSCRPRLSLDLGIADNDGRISDQEIAKYYPPDTWIRLRVKRGTVVIMHGNGFHKGPSWLHPGDPQNKPRTALRFDLAGRKLHGRYTGQQKKIRTQDYKHLTELQKLFAKEFTIVDS